jgi:hypothetical protein
MHMNMVCPCKTYDILSSAAPPTVSVSETTTFMWPQTQAEYHAIDVINVLIFLLLFCMLKGQSWYHLQIVEVGNSKQQSE